jgi:hypothetical protein
MPLCSQLLIVKSETLDSKEQAILALSTPNNLCDLLEQIFVKTLPRMEAGYKIGFLCSGSSIICFVRKNSLT